MRLDWRSAESFDAIVAPELFGANILFDRDRVGPSGTFDDALEDAALGYVRYPGGSITEWYFDINDPDATQAWDPDLGAFRDLMPLSDFMRWAGAADVGVHLVIPTDSLMTPGAAGSRAPKNSAFDDVKTYVGDVLAGVYGDTPIDTFEIGNEYWHSAGQSVEDYLQIADVVARATQEAIDEFRASTRLPANWEEPKIAVQIGQYGEYSPTPGWQQNNRLIDGLSDPAAAAIDAVVVHYYTRGGFEGIGENHAYYFDRLDDWAKDTRFEGIEYHVTEWSTDNWLSEEQGLRQASTMIWMMSEMVARGVDAAHVWPLQQLTDNDLAGNEGELGLTVAGEGLRIMAEQLPGLTLERRLAFEAGTAWLYRDADEALLMVSSRSDTAETVEIDLAELGLRGWDMGVLTLGVTGAPNDPLAPPVIDIDTTFGAADGQVSIPLGAYETVQVSLVASGPTFRGLLAGSAHADTIKAGAAAERIDGRLGDDLLQAGAGADTVDGGDGADTIRGGDGADQLIGGDGDDIVDAGAGPDLILLGAGDDQFDDAGGGSGADKAFGGAGNDVLNGRAGPDSLSGDAGNDTINGGAGNDTGFGDSGADGLFGEAGDDDLSGGSGNDTLNGGDGNDSLRGDEGEDLLLGAFGNDMLLGGTGNDEVRAGGGDDLLGGGSGNDRLLGEAGNDVLSPGDGADTLLGGLGADTFVFDRDDGTNLLADFEPGLDRIDLRGRGLSEAAVSFDDAEITFAGTTLVFGQGAMATPDDFVFV